MLTFLLALSGCHSTGLRAPLGPVDLVYVDDQGVEWDREGGVLRRFRLTGPGCASADWFTVGIDDLWVQIVVPDQGVAVLDESVGVSSTSLASLWGATLTTVTDDPTEIEVQADDGCVIVIAGTATDPCGPQADPATIRITGPIDQYPVQPDPVDGEVGYATEATTGDPICGADLSL